MKIIETKGLRKMYIPLTSLFFFVYKYNIAPTDGEQPTYANPSEFRPPLSPLCHYYSPPGSPYEQPTVSSPASRAATMNHNYQTLELHQRGRVALAGSAASGGNSPLDAVRVDLAVMTSDSSGTALRDRGMHEEVIYHEPSEVSII